MFVQLENITTLKNKTNVTLSTERGSKQEQFQRMMAIGLLSGASGNCVRQLGGEIDFHKLNNLQNEFENLLWEMNKILPELDVKKQRFF